MNKPPKKKKIKKELSQDERHFGVVLENMDSKIDLLLFRMILNELKEKVGRDEFLVLEKRVMALGKTRR